MGSCSGLDFTSCRHRPANAIAFWVPSLSLLAFFLSILLGNRPGSLPQYLEWQQSLDFNTLQGFHTDAKPFHMMGVAVSCGALSAIHGVTVENTLYQTVRCLIHSKMMGIRRRDPIYTQPLLSRFWHCFLTSVGSIFMLFVRVMGLDQFH